MWVERLDDDDAEDDVGAGGDIGDKLCSGLWLPSESSLDKDDGGVGGSPKSMNKTKRYYFHQRYENEIISLDICGSILIFNFGINDILCCCVDCVVVVDGCDELLKRIC